MFKNIILITSITFNFLLFTSNFTYAMGWKMPVRSDSISYYAPCWGKDNKIYFIKKVVYGRYYHKWTGLIGPYSVEKVECYLCSMNYDGTDKKEITRIGVKKGGIIKDWVIKGAILGSDYRIGYGNFMDYCSANDMLVFADAVGIWVIKADGTGLKLIKKDGAHPSWSPDGKKIVYNQMGSGYFDKKYGTYVIGYEGYKNKGIYVMDLDGNNAYKISSNGQYPIWSPKGNLIAFVCNGWIYVMKPDGSERRRVCNYRYLQDWSPDGTMLLAEPGFINLSGNIVKRI